ncbi:hypothetical protein B0O80DRAFT_503263 [Mortierella sp. GBAus27b]|nr:hypothetical protein BGX31_009903 [Mortierella sp. GBA43]KAI8346617.1 hypothetical protein B0O80DRAFT_503263 [Mortierella sp. GBAus27b]
MSKRGTENQITKDDYDRDEEEETSQEMGTFKKASNEELARRPMKAMRRLGARTSSNLSDDGTKRPSPFAAFGTISASSSQPSTEEPAKPANPFAAFTFGVPAASTTATPVTSAPTFASFQPKSSSKGPEERAPTSTSNQETTGATSATTTTTPIPNTFTFNIGSQASALIGSGSDSAVNGDDKSEPLTREQYERTLRGLNQTFLKKIQKYLEIQPTINLSQMFNQYMEQRMAARKAYGGVELQETVVMPSDMNSDNSGSATTITRMTTGGANSPRTGFGLPFDIKNNAKDNTGFSSTPKAASPTSASGNSSSAAIPPVQSSSSVFPSLGGAGSFTFGSTSVKGAVDPPKNPTTFNFGLPIGTSSAPPTTSSTSSPPTAAASTTPTPFSFAPSKSFSFSNLSSSGSTLGAGAEAPKPFAFSTGLTGASPGVNAPKPFAFSSLAFGSSSGSDATGGAPKPFAFSNPGLTSGSAGTSTPPKPFAFQVPPMVGSSQASSSDLGQDEDNDRMPDDTKSQLVENREGQEDEDTVFEVRARLYGIVNGENKDLGVGQFRVNENKSTKKRRMIMRTGGTGLVTLNSWVIQGMPAKRDKTVLTLFAIDDNKPKRFMLRVKEESAAEELFNALEAGQSSD